MTKKKIVKKEDDPTLEEITQPEYMRLVDQSTQHFKAYLEKLEEKYLTEVEKVNKMINDIYSQYRTTKMYEMDSNVKYYYDAKSGAITYKATKRPEHIGFQQ